MIKTIDFGELLNELFQEETPIRENEHEPPMEEKSTEYAPTNEANNSLLQACSLYIFMREIVMNHFGMGYDYAFNDWEGNPMKSWFTIADVIEMAKSQGSRLSVAEAKAYLDKLIKQGYIETDNYKYRRCALFDERMEEYLRRYS